MSEFGLGLIVGMFIVVLMWWLSLMHERREYRILKEAKKDEM